MAPHTLPKWLTTHHHISCRASCAQRSGHTCADCCTCPMDDTLFFFCSAWSAGASKLDSRASVRFSSAACTNTSPAVLCFTFSAILDTISLKYTIEATLMWELFHEELFLKLLKYGTMTARTSFDKILKFLAMLATVACQQQAFGAAYRPLVLAHSDPLWARTCFGRVNGAPG